MAPRRRRRQPQTVIFSWAKSLRELPFRICRPPPSFGKVRSWKVTPAIQISLEDILDRKHLPPLTLREFEDYLLFIERSAENLYFTLWLRAYTTKYAEWDQQSDKRFPVALSLSYMRAKSTFFSSLSSFELNISADAREAILSGNRHPNPSLLEPINKEVDELLRLSAARFVSWSLVNTGRIRALCGIIGGVACMFLGSIPVALSIRLNLAREIRLTAIVPMLVGCVATIAALQGVCFVIWIIGDFRQLRPFELARPAISPPTDLRKSQNSFELARTVTPGSIRDPQCCHDLEAATERAANDYEALGSQSGLSTNVPSGPVGPQFSSAIAPWEAATSSLSWAASDIVQHQQAIDKSVDLQHHHQVPSELDGSQPVLDNQSIKTGTDISIASDVPGVPFARASPVPSHSDDGLSEDRFGVDFDFNDLPPMYRRGVRWSSGGGYSTGFAFPQPPATRSSMGPSSATEDETYPSSLKSPITPLSPVYSARAPLRPSQHPQPDYSPEIKPRQATPAFFPSADTPLRLPLPHIPELGPTVPLFGPMTPILNPLIKRTQWLIFMRSFCISVVVTAGLMVALYMIPPVSSSSPMMEAS